MNHHLYTILTSGFRCDDPPVHDVRQVGSKDARYLLLNSSCFFRDSDLVAFFVALSQGTEDIASVELLAIARSFWSARGVRFRVGRAVLG